MINSDEFITSDKYLSYCLRNKDRGFLYYKYDFLYEDGIWRSSRVNKLMGTKCSTLMVGHSDYSFTNADYDKLGIDRVYSINNESDKGFGLPLGLTNYTSETELHPLYGNIMMMEHVQKQNVKKEELVYMNINVNTCMSKRVPVKKLFESKNWVYKGTHSDTVEGRMKFLYDIARSKYVVCPEGNGIDTHRLWETIYMGSIPIVKKNNVHRDWVDLPIYFVDEWSEVNKEELMSKWDEIKDRSVRKAEMSYWCDLFENTI